MTSTETDITKITQTRNMGNHVAKDHYHTKDCDAPSKSTSVPHYGDDDGKVDFSSFLKECMIEQAGWQAARKTNDDAFEDILLTLLAVPFDLDEDEAEQVEQLKKKRARREGVITVTDPLTGETRPMDPKETVWYNMYLAHPRPDNPKFQKSFRNRFRMPYESFLGLLSRLEESVLFDRWRSGARDAWGKSASPLGLLLLCGLRYLGRGWTMDDCAENSGISREVIRVFIHVFARWGATVLYDEFVVAPTEEEHFKDCEMEFAMAGFPGCIGSTDATHILQESMGYKFRQLHMGFKSTHTARTYNLTCNHRRRILFTTQGHPAAWNDKTLVRFDDFVVSIERGDLGKDHVFELLEQGPGDTYITRKYKGVWLIVDNGYLSWSCTVPPFKQTNSRGEIRFSQWLESMRKDVECTFGILKGRWRILKAGVRTRNVETADNIWKTCCAMHNMLLEADGLDEHWKDGIPTDWEGSGGAFGQQDVPAAIQRQFNEIERCDFLAGNLDFSGMGPGVDVSADGLVDQRRNRTMALDREYESNTQAGDDDGDGFVRVSELTLKKFRSCLVNHFNIAFKKNLVQWPSRNKRPITQQ
jgi:DDE superfamily endonuclease